MVSVWLFCSSTLSLISASYHFILLWWLFSHSDLFHSFCYFARDRTVTPRAGIRKYVVWCLICGGLSCLLGIMFLGVYFLVRSYTSTIGYFETVPTFVPATLVSNFAILCLRHSLNPAPQSHIPHPLILSNSIAM